MEGDFEDIKGLNYDDNELIQYFEANIGQHFYNDISQYINKWLESRFPKFTIVEKSSYCDESKKILFEL